MSWIALAFGAALSWGMYGASLHRGQLALGNPMRALLCVGVAYFLIGVLVPAGVLSSQGEMRNFNADRDDDGDLCRRARRDRRGLHHLRVQERRLADLRDADRVRRSRRS